MAMRGRWSAILRPAALLNVAARAKSMRIETGVAYGRGDRQRLDLYAPSTPASQAPIVLFFYGGSWQGGSRATYRFLAADLAARGFIALVPDYTVYPEGRYPAFLEDGARAVAWAQENRGRLGSPDGKLFLMGHSAGAHIAAMLAFDARWLGSCGLDPRGDVGGLVGLAGPYDFLPIQDPVIKLIFASDRPQDTQPIAHVTGGEAPVFLGVAPADRTVRPGNSERLARRLETVGSAVVLRRYPRTNHITLVGAFSPLLRWLGPVADDVAMFLRQISAGGRSGQPRHREETGGRG